jgi:hypothetical protein
VQRFVYVTAFRFRGVTLLVPFKNSKHSVGRINRVEFCAVETRNMAQVSDTRRKFDSSIFDASRALTRK